MPSAEFFQVMPVAAALRLLDAHWQPAAATETLATAAALGRALAGDVHAPEPVPAFRKSTVDGYALRAADSFGASPTLPAFLALRGELPMGAAPALDIGAGEALLIHTGGMLPANADAVAMLEHSQALHASELELLRPLAPGENVIQAGEDVAAGQLILAAGSRLRPQDIGALLAVGITEIAVSARPRIGILSCGDELLPPAAALSPGKIRDINSYTLSALAEALGGQAQRLGIARDERAEYQQRARAGLHACDILLLSAGSSVSARDHTSAVISALGPPGILQHGLATKPGKPTIIAVCGGKPVIGLPGNPVSALMVTRHLLPHLIARFEGARLAEPQPRRAQLTQRVASATGREDWVAVRLHERAGGGLMAQPLFGKSNLIFTLVGADGLLRVPLNTGGFDAGAIVEIQPF